MVHSIHQHSWHWNRRRQGRKSARRWLKIIGGANSRKLPTWRQATTLGDSYHVGHSHFGQTPWETMEAEERRGGRERREERERELFFSPCIAEWARDIVRQLRGIRKRSETVIECRSSHLQKPNKSKQHKTTTQPNTNRPVKTRKKSETRRHLFHHAVVLHAIHVKVEMSFMSEVSYMWQESSEPDG